MLTFLARLFLTGMAIAPVLFVYAVMAFVESHIRCAVALLLICLVLFGAGLGSLHFANKWAEQFSFSITAVESADRESLGVLLVYLLPLLRVRFSDLSWHILVPAAAIFLALLATSSHFHFNPLLNMMGWHFYKVGTKEGVTYVLISRKHFRNVAETLTVGHLTKYTVIDVD